MIRFAIPAHHEIMSDIDNLYRSTIDEFLDGRSQLGAFLDESENPLADALRNGREITLTTPSPPPP